MGIYVFVVQMRWIAGRKVFWTCSPSPLIPLPSRERGIMVVVLACCLPRTPCPVVSRLRGNDGRFCKGLHQGRGGSVGCLDLFTRVTLPLWIADQVRNDGCHALLHPVDSRLRGNDGPVELSCFHPHL